MSHLFLHRYLRVGILGVLALVGGCGRKTLPVAPQLVAPAPIADLGYELEAQGVTLTWTAPRETLQGTELAEIAGFDVYRAVVDPEEHCPGCPLRYGKPVDAAVDEPQPGETIRFSETLLRPRHRYYYKVRTRYGWYHASPDSNVVSFIWDTPVSAPTDLQIASGDGWLRLTWKEPRTLLDGTEVEEELVYRVYRSTAGGVFEPVGSAADPGFTDSAVRNDLSYGYQVRALRAGQEDGPAGRPSEIVAASPRDLEPPAAPQHLTAVRVREGIKLVWQGVDAPDLAGYQVYRQLGRDQPRERIGYVAASETSFVDRNPAAGEAEYFVTALDLTEPANESPWSPGVKVRSE